MLNSELLKIFSTYDSNLRGDSIMRTIQFNKEVFQNQDNLELASELHFLAERNEDWTLENMDQGLKALDRKGFYRIISDPICRTTINIESGKEYPTWSANCYIAKEKVIKTIKLLEILDH